MPSLIRCLFRVPVVIQLFALLLAAFAPVAKAQDMEAAQELLDLTQKMQSADDPCPYLPQVRALMNRIANSDPEVYNAMKPQLDQINSMDLSCNNDSTQPAQPSANSSDEQNDAEPGEPAAPDHAKPASPSFSVRYIAGETRSLTDDEFAKLRSGLYYDPLTVPISPGGSATTVLKDSSGTSLVTVTVRWVSVVRNGSLRNGNFHITMQNNSNCLFTSSASFLIPSSPIDAQGVSFATWTSWVTLHEPLRGETTNFDGIATLGNDYASLVFKPDQPEYSLTQCRTPQTNTNSGASDSN